MAVRESTLHPPAAVDRAHHGVCPGQPGAVTYLVLVELAKSWFYASHHHHPQLPPTPAQRLERRIGRRAHRFTRHRGPQGKESS